MIFKIRPSKKISSFRFISFIFHPLIRLSFCQPLEVHSSPFIYALPEESVRFNYSDVPSTNNIGFKSFQEVIRTRNKNRLITCPGMIGPVEGSFYCHGIEHGYCDRRSGTCFCNKGYTGVSCDTCDHNHFIEGGLCYDKKPCPNSCSSKGSCDVKTGLCRCSEGIVGDDCSRTLCTIFHEFCTRCDRARCLECVEGWTPIQSNPLGSQCVSCHYLYDPRCSSCNETSCTECQDLLLLSIHRSGRRNIDPELPFDEREREFGISIPFGSQQTNAFDEAQHYFIASPELTPLKSYAVSCDQGYSDDSSFDCKHIKISNILCGNYGSINFSRTHYEVKEGDGFIRLQIKRSGGGIGQVSVSYEIEHFTTNESDVSPTAYYTDSHEINFSPHEIEKSFLITVYDDVVKEGNESFAVYLYNPTYPAELGGQFRTTVTIIDDDNNNTQMPIPSLDTHSVEYDESKLSLHLHSQYVHDEDSQDIFVYFSPQDLFHGGFISARRKGLRNATSMIWDLEDFDATINYTAHVVRLKRNGLMGYYFKDDVGFGIEPLKTRPDRAINFTAFESGVKCVRWEGFLKPFRSGLKTFFVQAKKSRLWIDGILIIDEWIMINGSSTISSGRYRVNTNELYSITLEVEVAVKDPIKLFWAFSDTSMRIIQPKNLYFQTGSTEIDIKAF